MRPCGHTGHHAIPFPANDPARPDPVHPRSGPLGHGTFPGPWPRLLLSPSPPPNLPPELPQDPGSRQNLERRSLMAPSSLVAEVHSPAQNHGLQDTHGRIHIPECSGPVPGEGTGGEPGVLKRRGARGVEAAPGTAGAGRPPCRWPGLPGWGWSALAGVSSAVTKGKRPLVTAGRGNTEGKANPGAAPASPCPGSSPWGDYKVMAGFSKPSRRAAAARREATCNHSRPAAVPPRNPGTLPPPDSGKPRTARLEVTAQAGPAQQRGPDVVWLSPRSPQTPSEAEFPEHGWAPPGGGGGAVPTDPTRPAAQTPDTTVPLAPVQQGPAFLSPCGLSSASDHVLIRHPWGLVGGLPCRAVLRGLQAQPEHSFPAGTPRPLCTSPPPPRKQGLSHAGAPHGWGLGSQVTLSPGWGRGTHRRSFSAPPRLWV